MSFKTTKFEEEDTCPNCGHILSAATSDTGATPEPGDYSICIECCSFLQFDDNMKHILISDDDVKYSLPVDVSIALMTAKSRIQASKAVAYGKK